MPTLEELLALQRQLEQNPLTIPKKQGPDSFGFRNTDARPQYQQGPEDVSRFDKGRMLGQDANDYRAEQQDWRWEVPAAIGRTLGQTLAKTSQGFSMLGSAVGAGIAGTIDGTGIDNLFGQEMDDKYHSIDAIVNNPINKIFYDMEDKIKEVMPVYHGSDWDDRSASDKFFGNFSEWLADQGADGIAFALSAFVPSAAMSKIGLGASLLGSTGRGATAIAKFLSKAGVGEKGLSALAKGVDLASQYGIQTSVEALFEAKDTGEQLMHKYLENLNATLSPEQQYQSIEDLPEDLRKDLTEKMTGAMKNDYAWNMLALAPSNLFEIGLINKFLGKTAKGAGNVARNIDAGADIASDAARATEKVSKFKNFTNKLDNILSTRVGSALSNVSKSAVSEGLWEENIQSQLADMSQQFGLEGKSGYFLESGIGALRQATEAILNPDDPKYAETRESMLAGAFIGSLFGGIAGATSEFNAKKQEVATKEDKINRAIDFLNTAKSNFLQQDLYQTREVTDADGAIRKEVIFDENNEPVINQEAIANFLSNQKRMQDLAQAEEYYTGLGKKEMANIIRDERTTDWALAHLQAGLGDKMFGKIDQLASAKDEDLQKLGFDPTYFDEYGKARSIAQRTEDLREKASQVKQAYEDITRSISPEQAARVEELVRLKMRTQSLKKQSDALIRRRQAFEAGIIDNQSYVTELDRNAYLLKAIEDNISSLEKRQPANRFEAERIAHTIKLHKEDANRLRKIIDDKKTSFTNELIEAGLNNIPGEYTPVGKYTDEQLAEIQNITKEATQLSGATQEALYEYNQLMKPFEGANRMRERLGDFIQEATFDAEQDELDEETIDTSAQTPVVPQPVTQPVTANLSIPDDGGKNNHIKAYRDLVSTNGALDPAKLDKFASDNMGRTFKIKYKNNKGVTVTKDSTITSLQDGRPAVAIGNSVQPIDTLFAPSVYDIRSTFKPKAKEVIEDDTYTEETQKQAESFFIGSKPYLSVAVNATTGLDQIGNAPDQERWFRTTENLDLDSGKFQLLSVTNNNKDAVKILLGEDWDNNLLFDDTTIKMLLFKDGKPFKANEQGEEDATGGLVYTSMRLVPKKENLGVVEYRDNKSFADALKKNPKLKGYTHQGDANARYIVTEEEVSNGTADRLLKDFEDLRTGLLADTETKFHTVTGKGFGIRQKTDKPGPVQGRLTDKAYVDVEIATGQTMLGSSGPVRVKPGMAYTMYKGVVVPLINRKLNQEDRKNVIFALANWADNNSGLTKSSIIEDLSNAIDANNKKAISELSTKLRKINTPFLEDLTNKVLSGKSLTVEELDSLTTSSLASTKLRNNLKTYLERTINLGKESGIYIEKGRVHFGKESISEIDLREGRTEALDKFLANRYLQISKPALNNDKGHTEIFQNEALVIDSRQWNTYKEYLTSNVYPNGSARPESEIPLKTSLQYIGQPQLRSVNLLFDGNTEARKPVRKDTKSEVTKDKVRPLKFQEVADKIKNLEVGKTYRVALRFTDKTKDQTLFYIDAVAETGDTQPQLKPVKFTKRDGTESNKVPDSIWNLVNELNDVDTAIAVRPNDVALEYISITNSPVVNTAGESVVSASPVILSTPQGTVVDQVIAELEKEGTFDRSNLVDLTDVVTDLQSQGITNVTDLARFYRENNPGAIVIKINPAKGRSRVSRGMKAGSASHTGYANLEAEEAWFKNRFPQLDFKRVTGLIAGKYWGLFDSQLGVLASTEAPNGVAYHEAFHVASLMYSTTEARKEVYNEWRNRTGKNLPDIQVEEALAEEFRDYVLTEGKYTFPEKQKSFFERLWQAIKAFILGRNENQIESLFNKIQSGGFRNSEAINDLHVSAPMTPDLAEQMTRTYAIMEDMTVQFFNEFFGDGHNIDTLFNIYENNKTTIRIDEIYSTLKELYIADFEAYKEENKGAEDTILASVVNNWNGFVKQHKEFLTNLGLNVVEKTPADTTAAEDNTDTNLETEGTKDNAQMETHIEFSSKEGMPRLVKFFLSTLPEVERTSEGLQHVQNDYGLDKLYDAEKLMNTLANQLAGMTDINEMVQKIAELSIDYPVLERLLSRMQLGSELLPLTATDNQATFQTMFWQQFAKTHHEYYLTLIREDGSVSTFNSNSGRQVEITKEKWKSNLNQELLKADSVLSKIDNRIVINKEKLEGIYKTTDPIKVAEKLGIKYSRPDRITGELKKEFIREFGPLVQTLLSSGRPVSSIYSKRDLDVQTRVEKLAALEAKTSPDAIERQHINPSGKTVYSIVLNNSLSLGIGELNKRKGHWYDSINTSVYSKNSVVLQRLKEDPDYTIELAVHEGLKNQTADGIETSKLTPADAMAGMINSILNGQYSLIRPGDKKLEYKLKLGQFISPESINTQKGQTTSKVLTIFKNYLVDELNRVVELNQGFGVNTQFYNNRTDLGIFNDVLSIKPSPANLTDIEAVTSWLELNNEVILEDINKYLSATTISYGEAARKLSIFKQLTTKEGKGKKATYLGTGKFMLNGIDNRIVNEILGKEADNKEYTSNDVLDFFKYVTVNQLIANFEQTKLLTGDFSFYKNEGDVLKRTSALTGTKKIARVDDAFTNWLNHNKPKVGYVNGRRIKLSQDGQLRFTVIADIISSIPQELRDNYLAGLKANGITGEEASEMLSGFNKVNEADAQSWMTLPAYREFLLRVGDWTASHEKAYKKAIKGQPLGEEIFLFPPLKPQGYGPQYAQGLNPVFIKTSVSPLIPSVVKGTDLEGLMNKMYEDDVDLVSTESAVKIGAKLDPETDLFVPFYQNDNGTAKVSEQALSSSKMMLPYQYFGVQLDVAPIRKEKTTRGTQHEKLLLSNLKNIKGGEEILAEYRNTIAKLVEVARNKMMAELGITVVGKQYTIPDRNKLLNYLEKQAIRRGVPTNTLLGLREALLKGSTLDATVNKDRIDSILASLINSGTIKAKRKGEQKIQVSVTGYGQRTFDGNNLLTDSTLSPYIYDANGTKPMEVMVALPKSLIPYVNSVGGIDVFNQMIANGQIDERLFTGVGFRIPTQQLSSMVYYKVKKFLPYESGPIVVLPSVITNIAGSDFDIDKLTMYEKNFSITGVEMTPEIKTRLVNSIKTALGESGLRTSFRKLTGKDISELSDDQLVEEAQAAIDYIDAQEDESKIFEMQELLAKVYSETVPNISISYVESDGNSQAALENKLIEINEKVLSHPSNFKNLIAPIGNVTLKNLATKMAGFNTSQDFGSAKLHNMVYLLEQGQRFQAGKDLLGIAAKQNTHHVLSQIAGLELYKDVKAWFTETKGKQLRLDHIKDLAGKHQISDIISEFINGFVDIVKDQFMFDLNANQDTINQFFYLVRIGVPIESVTSFLNQPIIKEYIFEKNKNNSLLMPEAYKKSNYRVINDLRTKYNQTAKSLDFKEKMPHYQENPKTKESSRKRYPNFTLSQLDSNLGKSEFTDSEALQQLQILDMFLQYQDDSRQLTELMMLNSQDTDGVKKKLSRSYVESNKYKELINRPDSIFINPHAIVANSLIEPYYNIVTEAEGYLRELFDTKSEKANSIREQFLSTIKALGVDDSTDFMSKFENHLLTHLLHTTKDSSNIPLGLQAKSLLTGNNSTAQQLTKLRKAVNDAVERGERVPNEFLNSLFDITATERTEGDYIDNIRIFNKRLNKQASDILSGAAQDLLNTSPDIAKRIFKTTLVQSGLNNTFMSYHNLLPAQWYHNYVREVLDVFRNTNVNLNNVIDDFYRNNWRNNKLVPTVKGKAANDIDSNTIEISAADGRYNTRMYVKRWVIPDGISKKEFWEKRADESIAEEDKPAWELRLYKFAEAGNDVIWYKRVNPLGQGERYLELSSEWKPQSLLNNNNKVDGDLVSSKEFFEYIDFRPLEVEQQVTPDNVPVSEDITNRLQKVYNDIVANGGTPVGTIEEALEDYKRGLSLGMTEEQAKMYAEQRIICPF